MTTPDPHTNNPHDLVPHLVPDLVPGADGADGETTSSPVPSSSIGDEVSEPPRPRPTTSSPDRDEHPAEHPVTTASNLMDSGDDGPPHGPGLAAAREVLREEIRVTSIYDVNLPGLLRAADLIGVPPAAAEDQL